METEQIQKIIHFADRSHGNQMRRYTNERYIVHPVRVMEICRQYSGDPAVLAAALLHDVLEDTPVSQNEILTFLLTVVSPPVASEIVGLVIELTDIYTKERFPRLNRRQRRQKEFERLSTASVKAQTIKYADVIDNSLDIFRHDPDFAPVFLRESEALLSYLTKGNKNLRDHAIETVRSCLKSVTKKPVS